MYQPVPPSKQTPQEMVKLLVDNHWKQEAIASESKTSQATISRILRGKIQDPHHKLVDELRSLVSNLSRFKPIDVTADRRDPE